MMVKRIVFVKVFRLDFRGDSYVVLRTAYGEYSGHFFFFSPMVSESGRLKIDG